MSYQPKGPCLNAMLGLPAILPDGAYIRTTRGFFALTGNEHFQVTTDPDPAACSLIGFTGGKWSYKDDDGIERTMLMGRKTADGRNGEWAFFCWNEDRYQWALRQGTEAWTAKANDYAMMQVAILGSAGIEFDAAMIGRVNSGTMVAGDRVVSGNGRFVEIIQDDGNKVTYDLHLGLLGDPNAAIHDEFTGHIRDMAPQ